MPARFKLKWSTFSSRLDQSPCQDRAYTRLQNRRQRPEKLPSACCLDRLTAEWPPSGSSDGTRAKHLGLVVEPIEEALALIPFVCQKDAPIR